MHSNPADYNLIAPSSLDQALDILASEPGHFTPIAGGTELMVALGAGPSWPRKICFQSTILKSFALSKSPPMP